MVFARDTPREYRFVFVDGGVTVYNKPAFLAFQMATAAPYQVRWTTGVDELLLVSVGTGGAPAERPDLRPRDLNVLHYALSIPSALMNGASAGWDMACRTLGECRFGLPIDREFGTMQLDPGAGRSADTSNWTGAKAFSYVRYDPELTRAGLDEFGLRDVDPARVRKMDSVEHIADMQRVGLAFAEKYVHTATHLKGFVHR